MGVWRVPYHGATGDFLREHVDATTNDCILWPYAKNAAGYGIAVIDGKQRTANNWMCRLRYGEPFSIWNEAAHSCGKPACVNPRHLRWANRASNQRDRVAHKTSNHGSRNGKTKLTEADVVAIKLSPAKYAILAERFGVSLKCIQHIRAGTRWAHVKADRWSDESREAA